MKSLYKMWKTTKKARENKEDYIRKFNEGGKSFSNIKCAFNANILINKSGVLYNTKITSEYFFIPIQNIKKVQVKTDEELSKHVIDNKIPLIGDLNLPRNVHFFLIINYTENNIELEKTIESKMANLGVTSILKARQQYNEDHPKCKKRLLKRKHNKLGAVFMNLKGKVAIVTGASRGIGKGIAIELAKAGACVVINYKSNDEAAEKTLQEIRELGAYALKIKGDVSDYEFSKQLIKTTVEKLGKIDILINNAGISKVGLFMDASPVEWDNILNVNLKGTINCSHSVVKEMINQKSGIIINISSMWGNVGASCEVIYSASKGAINSFTKALAKELAPSNIRVNAIAPGVIDTEMNAWLSLEERKSLIDEIPMMKVGEVQDVGMLVTFLASENSKYITGQVITIDGGMQ